MPLIATLVPAYKADFLAPLFAGLRAQTLRDFRVIVSDDSPGATITEALKAGRFDAWIEGLDLTVVRGPCSPLKNHQHLLDTWARSTPLVHLLMDDDVIYPDFYRAHAELHASQRLSASVSLRWLTGTGGEPLGTLPLPAFVTQSAARTLEVDTATLFDSTVARSENWLGELSNMVFTAEAAACFPRPPTAGVSYFGLPDVGLLLNAANIGPIRLLRDHLSGFRQHPSQTTANTQSTNLKIAHLAWVAFALKARRDHRLNDARVVQGIVAATQRCLQVYGGDAVLQRYFAIVQASLADLDRFEAGFGAFWQELLRSCPDACDWPDPVATPAESPRAAPRPARLAVIDDFFPNLLTGFRVAEYNAYLEVYPDAQVLSTATDFAARHAEYATRHTALAPRVQPFSAESLARQDLAMMNFLNNAVRYLPALESRQLPFVLTLYPGGGFGIGCPASDAKLARVLASPLLQLLVTTQPITTEYVREFAQQRNMRLPALHELRGGVMNPSYFADDLPAHAPYFGDGKVHVDICFVAEKYMPRGVNKGYPEFIAAAHELLDIPTLRFHVVGGFTPQDIDVCPLGDRIRFHGRLETPQLQRFYADMDLIVALSRPGSLHPGNFDGFPTGAAVEASLAGVAVLASDVLEQNPGYVDGESMLFVAPHAAEVVRRVRALWAEPARIASIARAGRALSRQLFAPQAQIAPRIALLDQVAQRLGMDLRRR